MLFFGFQDRVTWSFVVAMWQDDKIHFLSLPILGGAQSTPSLLCVADGLLFKTEIQRRTRLSMKAMFGGRLKEMPKSLVHHIFGFLIQKHVTESGVTFLRISMPICVRVLTQLHYDRDEAPLADWIRYPFSLDS